MKITDQNLKILFLYIIKLTIGYIIVALSVFFLLNNATIIDAVTALKIFSLFALLLVNGEVARGIDKDQKDIKRLNYFILSITALILIIVSAKMLGGLDLSKSKMSPILMDTYKIINGHVFWLSAFPLFAYAFLDLYIVLFRSKSTTKEKLVASNYLVFADLICIFPLVAVFLLISSRQLLSSVSQINYELFISGSMGIVLLSSAIAVRAVDLFMED